MQWFTEALVSEKRTRERLSVILRGAFSTSPAPAEKCSEENWWPAEATQAEEKV
jgi:hypothetical protein